MAAVLVVEDDPDVLALLCDAIAAAGHAVECVGTYAEGGDRLSAGTFDLVVANARLPDGSGIDLADKAMQQGAKAMIVTGHPDAMQVLAAQGRAFVRKPFRLDEMVREIERLVGPATP
jgi:DNA-binding response OmpR family regulator